MPVTVAEGIVEVTADVSGVGRQIAADVEKGSPDADRAGQSVGKSVFKGVVGGWAAIGGTKLVADFFTGAITGASDLAETVSKSNTIFGGQASKVESWASKAAGTMGLSKAAALEAAAGFGNMFSQIGFGGKEAADMSKSVVQMSADLGSFNNLPTADVSERIGAAMRGEYDSLQALIPNINAARVEQEAMAATGKDHADQLTAQEKAAAVLSIVHKDGAAAMGDYAKTADGAANTQKTLTASLDDQQAKLGTTLMPLWQGFLGFLTDTAIPALTTIVDWIGKNADWLGPLAVAIGVASAAMWIFNAAMAANPIGLVVGAIALLVAGIVWVATQTTFFQDVWNGAMHVIGAIGQWLWNSAIKPAIDGIVGGFNWVMGVIGGVANFITDAITNVGNTVRSIFGGIGSFIGGAFSAAVGAVRGPINGLIGLINGAIKGLNKIHVTIPDWVPLVGGQTFGLHIPTIPMLARGTNNAPDAFIAGEAGPELITGARGATVRPYSATSDLLARGAGQKVTVELTQNISHPDPVIAGRQAARALTARLGI